ncbi:outer membrane lipid asymmetry maintenance protein MlaD [Tabrizicola sp.]|uniref:outer membrane lipid asymmetry maintenance protein MlaD n=1 Tax=Tabrizicola sp. TaxID=2005166 RepID=UPI002734458D|nr:outer membrane lipid asymmetry maintenance protein MlaD [Tabrizicola sp.]MDP3195727.1 outer membrane lipid asymmetry maintenance protein MlaD [Tabrizicola sp.]
MAYERAEIVAGAAVLAIAAAFALYAVQGSGVVSQPSSYPLTASFRSVEGVNVGTDVRLAGVKVGTVTALSLNPETFFADATISMRNDVALPVDSTLLVSSEGLLGGTFVEVQPGGALEVLEPGGEIEDTQGAVSLITLLMKFAGGGGEGNAVPDATATP